MRVYFGIAMSTPGGIRTTLRTVASITKSSSRGTMKAMQRKPVIVASMAHSTPPTQSRKTQGAHGLHREGRASDNGGSPSGRKTTTITDKQAWRAKGMRYTPCSSFNIRHDLSSINGPKRLQREVLTSHVP